jgi:hypothetical protein
MIHTCNLLPRIQAEGVGPATFLGRRLAKVLALGFLPAILGLSLSWLSDNPFALTFQTGAVLITAGLIVVAVAALMMLFRSRRVLARIVAAFCIVVGLLSVFLVGIIAAKNRILWRSHLTKESWQQDVRYLSDLTVRVHPNAFAHVSQDTYDQEIANLQAQLSTLTDQQIEMRLVHLVAILQDGHSTLFPFQPATGFRMLPLQLFLFSDGWYITDARPRYKWMVGRRVLRIGSKSVDQAYSKLRPFVGADNEATVEDRAPFYLLCPEVLQAEGITPDSDSVRFSIEGPQGAPTELDIEPVALTTYLYWYFAPLQAWKRKPPQAALPFYRQSTWDNYWFRYFERQRTVYVAFNQVRDKSDEPFEAFGARVLDFCTKQNAQTLVIDLRNNSGGDNSIFREFIQRLHASPMNTRGRLYALIGRHTFSAAVNFTSALERNTNIIFVGEAAGAGPNHFGDPKRYILPHSKLWVFIASKYHEWGSPNDQRRAHEANIAVPVSHIDYFSNKDPVLDAVLARTTPNSLKD